ncbi:MAG TPA: decaprenyl-phosphate phosphoribosyltransferase [Kofleriaceae bacterium]|nr:decaprenyl-phosphate phosphoribosyltransferase [Kofleriaceae bacterium]
MELRREVDLVSTATALIKTLRPHQWVKNVFVAAALVFSRHLGDPAYVIRTALAVLAFCMLSGAVYTFNDVRDADEDRLHPTKKHRPIAAGALSERSALIWAAILAGGALAGCLVLSWKLAVFASLYLMQNVAYSIKLKHIAFIDVLVIASGFLLRVLAGAAAIDVKASHWVLICTALLAMFFGLGKRAHELAWAARTGQKAETRAALAGYNIPVVRACMFVLAIATAAAYLAYTVDPHTVAFFGTSNLPYSTPFVVVGLIRFMFLALWWPKDDSPTEAMLKDPWFLLDLVGATATVLYIIYG